MIRDYNHLYAVIYKAQAIPRTEVWGVRFKVGQLFEIVRRR